MSMHSDTTKNNKERSKLFIDKIASLDILLSTKIYHMRMSETLEWALLIPALLFGRHVLPILICIIALFIPFRYSLYISTCCIFTLFITEPMKYIFARKRPSEDVVNKRVISLRKDVSNPAFPSGDSAQAAVISGILYTLSNNYLSLLLPLPTMFSRVYFGVHWIGDTLGGYFIGLLVGIYIAPLVF